LHKDPKKRPSLEQIKKDPFFSEIDWAKLARREVMPPSTL
jgi:hypothetical protein